jgi:hypothetical protein
MKKEIYIPLILIGLSVAFVVVSFLLWLSRGNDTLLKKKLRIGALIISLSGIALGCWSERDCVSCYLVIPDNQFIVEDQNIGGGIVLDMSVTNKLTGKITHRADEDFWYLIRGQNGDEVQRGMVDPLDGAYDEPEEEFEILVRIDLATGEYQLEFYLLEEEHPLSYFTLRVMND